MSEQYAERLYGPAPTGDEDPHASQAVPDPGEASGPPALTAGQLGTVHLGQRVRVTEGRRRAAGTLSAVDHRANWINDAPMRAPYAPAMIGRRYVTLHFGNMEVHVDPGATVELLD